MYVLFIMMKNFEQKLKYFFPFFFPQKTNLDVFNALNQRDNEVFLKELKFGEGDGNLHYYLFNWKCPPMKPEKVGVVLQ